ncbi:MAG: glycosyltransferase family 2 protein [Bifidobacteriaceae bacterium]|jgi:glycosyltransferase involved in cell wall biosynthesis|nr:glycosyltransferase family 2 protein [Bifidobacteriaceae bacterium]
MLISICVPLHNEAEGIQIFYESLLKVLKRMNKKFEIVFVDDGSGDDTVKNLKKVIKKDAKIKTRLLVLSRNFGKENALFAAVEKASGDAVIMLDGDGQHPVALIPDFIKKWEDSDANIVIGLRTENKSAGFLKNFGSKVYTKLVVGNIENGARFTDYCLIEKAVKEEFLRFGEHSRNNRQIISALGFQREFIEFKALPREAGEASYSGIKLMKLFFNSLITNTVRPLYLSLFLGIFTSAVSFVLGLFVLIEQFAMADPLQMKFSGVACLSIMLIFLVGIVFIFIGILSVYLSSIHHDTLNRPLYIVDKSKSII